MPKKRERGIKDDSRSLLHIACAEEPINLDEIQKLAKDTSISSLEDSVGQTALTYAARIKDPAQRLQVVRILLEAGIHPSVYNDEYNDSIENHQSPLIIALICKDRSDEVVRLLLEHGASIFVSITYYYNKIVESMENSLFVAARYGYIEAARMILDKAKQQCCIDTITSLGTGYKGQTVQATAIHAGHPEFVAPYEEYLASQMTGDSATHTEML